LKHLKRGDLVRVRIWRKEPFRKSLGLVIGERSKYSDVGTTWYQVWVNGATDIYFLDEIELIQAGHE